MNNYYNWIVKVKSSWNQYPGLYQVVTELDDVKEVVGYINNKVPSNPPFTRQDLFIYRVGDYYPTHAELMQEVKGA